MKRLSKDLVSSMFSGEHFHNPGRPVHRQKRSLHQGL